VRLRSVVVALVATVLPVLARAQTAAPEAHGSVSIPTNVVRTRAKENLDRAAAFVAMAREAPAAATDPANVHRASALAQASATAYRSASAEFAKGAYQKVTSASLRSISLAQDAIASASAAPSSATANTAPRVATGTTIVENVSGGDVALGAPDFTPDNSAAPVVRSRYHGAGPDAPSRPANWRVLGAVPFGADAVQGVRPNGAAGLGGYATPAPFGIVSPVQQPPFQPAG
jgi:hypothetical protein